MVKKKLSDDTIRAYILKNAVEHDGKAQVGSVIPGLFAEGLEKSGIKDIMPKVALLVNEINRIGLEVQKLNFAKLEKHIGHRKVKKEGELPVLPKVDKKKGVVMRIAPSPSGPLHLMHAINTSLNYLFVKKYGGKLYVRIEDTNPENIYKPAYEMIEQEAKWLTDGKAKVIIQSERVEKYYKYAEKLIKLEKSYVCTCDAEKFKVLVHRKEPCPCRDLDVKENTSRWEKMLDSKGYGAGEAVLRFKANLKDPNPAMRDFPLARINISKHPLTGNKYRVWPLMNLAVTVDDIELGMTHVIRGKDHKDNSKRQEMMYKVLKVKYPWVGFTGMTNFTDLKFSTSKWREDIDAKKYSGWDDLKLPTVASLKKRGYGVEAFRKLAAHTSRLDEVDKVISKKDFFAVLDRFNSEK